MTLSLICFRFFVVEIEIAQGKQGSTKPTTTGIGFHQFFYYPMRCHSTYQCCSFWSHKTPIRLNANAYHYMTDVESLREYLFHFLIT